VSTPHEFTWKQRGTIDHTIGTLFTQCPASDLFDAGEWRQGWLEGAQAEERRLLSVAVVAEKRVSARLQAR